MEFVRKHPSTQAMTIFLDASTGYSAAKMTQRCCVLPHKRSRSRWANLLALELNGT